MHDRGCDARRQIETFRPVFPFSHMGCAKAIRLLSLASLFVEAPRRCDAMRCPDARGRRDWHAACLSTRPQSPGGMMLDGRPLRAFLVETAGRQLPGLSVRRGQALQLRPGAPWVLLQANARLLRSSRMGRPVAIAALMNDLILRARSLMLCGTFRFELPILTFIQSKRCAGRLPNGMAPVISRLMMAWMIFPGHSYALSLCGAPEPRMSSARSAQLAAREGFMAISNVLGIDSIFDRPISNLVMFPPSGIAPPPGMPLGRCPGLRNAAWPPLGGRRV
jgi:hypothetical protein